MHHSELYKSHNPFLSTTPTLNTLPNLCPLLTQVCVRFWGVTEQRLAHGLCLHVVLELGTALFYPYQ